MTDSKQFDELTTKINRETSKIAWSELQFFFAQGRAVHVAEGQDLVKVAKWMAEDETENIERLMASGQFSRVSDETAKRWLRENTVVWAVVSAPWVIVQAASD